jgi:hypothetical protein
MASQKQSLRGWREQRSSARSQAGLGASELGKESLDIFSRVVGVAKLRLNSDPFCPMNDAKRVNAQPKSDSNRK